MSRHKGCRRVVHRPDCLCFKPAGVPQRGLGEIIISLDELEALRLADRDNLLQEQAAESMNVSRPTFTRIVGEARRKVATALCNGLIIRVEGGEIEFSHDDSATHEHEPHRRRHGCTHRDETGLSTPNAPHLSAHERGPGGRRGRRGRAD